MAAYTLVEVDELIERMPKEWYAQVQAELVAAGMKTDKDRNRWPGHWALYWHEGKTPQQAVKREVEIWSWEREDDC